MSDDELLTLYVAKFGGSLFCNQICVIIVAYLSWKVTAMSIFIHCTCIKQNQRFKVDKEKGK